MNNVDLRDGFPLAGEPVALVAASNRTSKSISLYAVDPVTRNLTDVAARTLSVALSESYGLAMYHSPTSGKFYAFVSDKDYGNVEQWELFDNGAGKVDGASGARRSMSAPSLKACVADDQTGRLYVAEEGGGIWRYGAEPGDGSSRVKIDSVGAGQLTADVEGLAIYHAADGTGYLIASSQGSNDFAVYDRQTGAYVTRFNIGSGAFDRVSDTDGIEVASFSLGAGAFAEGMFVAQDGSNDDGNQNFKLLSWGDIARELSENRHDAGPASSAAPVPAPEPEPVAVPTAPFSLQASAASSSQVGLNWVDASSDEAGFVIERSSDGINFTKVTTVGPNVTSHTDSGLSPVTTYHYRVSAYNSAGTSPASARDRDDAGDAGSGAAPHGDAGRGGVDLEVPRRRLGPSYRLARPVLRRRRVALSAWRSSATATRSRRP